MSDYDFKSLSPWEFEQLSRDLLKASLNLDFELFKSGQDQGVDLRYSTDKSNNIIAQCKHYANSDFSNLKHSLKNSEIQKINRLSPARYILVTSLSLTPKNKEEIASILGKYLISFSDIVTRETLNGWLTANPDIEKSHIKLWATTGTVLERIIHSGIFNYSIAQKDLLKEKLNYYVKNRSFDDSIKIIDEQRFCIIAGMPGIGKSTLAEMLLIEFMSRGYEPIRISADIEEAFKVYNPNKLQAFYYDDFLGQTGLDQKLNKNEDQRIADFCRICSKSSRNIFIMTTREYILNQAKITYEKLERSGLDIHKCVIDISSFAKIDRAKILYNHLYFRALRRDYVLEIIKDKAYLRIVEHKSFNPRVIEWMTDSISLSGISPDKYIDEFIARLDHPAMIWDHAYNHQISNSAKHLLLAVLSLPGIVLLANCKEVFENFRKQYCETFAEPRAYNEFNAALKESEGNFLRVDLTEGHQTLQFHNPSIRDYLTYFLSKENDLLRLLIQSFTHFDQSVSLWNSFSSLEENPLHDNPKILAIFQDRLVKTIDSDSLRFIRHASAGQQTIRLYKPNIHDRCRFILTLDMKAVSDSLRTKIGDIIENIFSNLNNIYDWSDIATLLRALKSYGPAYNLSIESHLEKTLDILVNNLSQTSDYRQLAEICYEHPQAYQRISGDFDKLAEELRKNLDDELLYIGSTNDIGSLEECSDDIQRVEDVLHVDLSGELKKVRKIIKEIEDNIEPEIEEAKVRSTRSTINVEPEFIISMFETLN